MAGKCYATEVRRGTLCLSRRTSARLLWVRAFSHLKRKCPSSFGGIRKGPFRARKGLLRLFLLCIWLSPTAKALVRRQEKYTPEPNDLCRNNIPTSANINLQSSNTPINPNWYSRWNNSPPNHDVLMIS